MIGGTRPRSKSALLLGRHPAFQSLPINADGIHVHTEVLSEHCCQCQNARIVHQECGDWANMAASQTSQEMMLGEMA